MRISNRGIQDRLLQHVQTATSRLQETQERLASGRRLTRPSDDPFALARALEARSQLQNVAQRSRTTDLAITELSVVETQLASVGGVLTRVQELAVQADSAALNADARNQIATEVEQLINEVLSIANTAYAGRRIFGGHQGVEPFTPDNAVLPSVVAFNGDGGQVLREIGDGETVAVNLDGAALFDGIFDSLIAFRDGLRANDRGAINAAASGVGTEIDTVLTARGEVGARMRRLESAWDRLGQEDLSLRSQVSRLEEVDITAEVVELQVRDTAFQAALSATGRTLGRSLLDFLR